MHFAHPLPAPRIFCGRAAELEALASAHQHGGLICIEGMGGAGKTATLAEFLRRIAPSAADGFVWSFYVQADAQAMLRALHEMLTQSAEEHGARASAALPVALEETEETAGGGVVAMLAERRGFILVLDGFERMQAADAPHAIEDESLRHFLEKLAQVDGVMCVCASRLAVALDAPLHIIPVGGLRADDAIELLRARGLSGSEDVLAEVVRHYAGHPLTLSLVAGAVGQFMQGDATRHQDVRSEGSVSMPWMGSAEEALTRVLGFYRERLSPQAVALLARLSLFRGPADERTLESVFLRHSARVGGDLYGLSGDALHSLLEELDALGLVEHVDTHLWVAHAVVRDFFPPTLIDTRGVHIAVAHFLGIRPAGGEGQSPPRARAALEEAIYHALQADAFPFALDLYRQRLGAAHLLCEQGDLGRGERVVRALLATPATPEITAFFSHELLIYLDEQGHVEEGARWGFRALRLELRQRRWVEVCRLLRNLSHNAWRRGRLPRAEKLASRALDVYQSEKLNDGASPVNYVMYLRSLRSMRSMSPEELWKSGGSTPDLFLVAKTLLLHGRVMQAYGIARQVWLPRRLMSEATDQRAQLLFARATFELNLANGAIPSRLAARVASRPDVRRVVEASRLSGRRPLLVAALLFNARLARLSGDTSGALNQLAEAEELCRRHGLLLSLVDVLLESRHFFGAEPVREAYGIATRPEVDYGWAAAEAGTWLALQAGGAEGAVLEAKCAEAMRARRSIDTPAGDDVPPAVQDTGAANAEEYAPELLPGERFLYGIDAPDHLVEVPGPLDTCLLVPVEAEFFAAIVQLRDADDDAAFQLRYETLWDAYYNSHLRDRDLAGPLHHLAVLFLLEGRRVQAATVADELRTRRPPFAGAACVAAACASSVSAALDVLRHPMPSAAEVDGAAPAVHLAAACNLGLLQEREGRVEDARCAYERALRIDWCSTFARQRLKRLDAAAETRGRCRTVMRQSMQAAVHWRDRFGAWPNVLDDLSRGLMRATPCCPERGAAYLYRATADRALIACAVHRLRLDSRRGDLTPGATSLSEDVARLFHRIRRIGNASFRPTLAQPVH